jgi:ribose/xylose/arabinose/galactoside ABC-type transport system permease subunit
MPDSLMIHLIWEGILLVVAIAVVGAALGTTSGTGLSSVLGQAGVIGFLAVGLSLSVRTASANLAVGSIALFTGTLGAHLAAVDRWPFWGAMAVAVVIATAAGLIIGLLTAALSIPAWAVTVGVAILLEAIAQGISGGQSIPVQTGPYPAPLWLAAFAIVSVAGGAVWRIPGVRTALSTARSAREPGSRAGLRAGLGPVIGLTGSSFLAAVAGVSMTAYFQSSTLASDGPGLTVSALAAVLIGGVSVFGARAGVAGTLLAVIIMSALEFLFSAHGFSVYLVAAVAPCLLLLGLGVSRAGEMFADLLAHPSRDPSTRLVRG